MDLSLPMLQFARLKIPKGSGWAQASAERLPFRSGSFDAIMSAFTLRNLKKILPESLDEMWRVLKPGGRVFLLEMTVPPSKIIRTFHHLYLKTVLPMVGRAVFNKEWSGDYLSETILHFWTPEEFCKILIEAKFEGVQFKSISGGIAVLHSAVKPLKSN